MKKRFNQKGFSMGEVLIVVAIIVVLAGVGFVALMTHMRNMHQLEMDGHAKEIFVAAQNHLSMAKGQDYLGLSSESDFGAVSPLTFTTVVGDETKVEKDADKGIYYLLVDDASDLTNIGVLKQMLPFASMDEAARTGGSYIIRYQKDPGIVLDVFYAEKGTKRFAHTLKTDDYEKLMSSEYYGDAGKDKRRNYSLNGASHAVIGWYGGSTASVPTGEKLKTPGVEIENGDRLLVRVTNYNEIKDGNELVLVIGNDVKPISIKLAGSDAASDLNAYRVTYNSTDKTYTIVLDDVTTDKSANPDKLHFAQLSTDSAFTASVPGRNIDVYAIAYNNQYLSNIAQSPTQTTNSLFASYHAADTEAAVPAYVEIASIRHLLNLDATISGLSNTVSFNIANQISDLVWDDGDTTEENGFLDNTRKAATRIYTYNGGGAAEISEAGYYLPVNPKDTIDYRGLSGTNHITGIKVDYSGDAGLFGSLSGSVSDLELIDFNIEGTANVGALAGSTDGANITGVLVHNSKTGGTETHTSGADVGYVIHSSSGSAGGLVGSMTDGSVKMCAAAVYVQGAKNAGGLIGTVTGGTVEDSYSGGHTENARYVSDTALPVAGSSATNVTVVNVLTGDEGVAGGLIGSARGTTIRYCYSTASAAPASGKATVGGLIGSATAKDSVKTKITSCYAIGLVEGGTGGTASSFVGNYTGTDFSGGNNYYMESGTPNNGGYASLTSDDGTVKYVIAAAEGMDLPNFFISKADQQDAYPYDKALLVAYKEGNAGTKVLYCFPTIEQLHTKNSGSLSIGTTDAGLAAFRRSFLTKHYGDWQLTSLSPLNYMLVNGDALDLQIELKKDTEYITLAVSGGTSGITRGYLFKVNWDANPSTAANPVTGLELQKITAVQKNGTVEAFADWVDAGNELKTIAAGRFNYIGKRTLSETDNSETVYDIHFYLDAINSATMQQSGHFAKLFSDSSISFTVPDPTEDKPDQTKSVAQDLLPGENITVRLCAGEGSWAELKDTCKFFAMLDSTEQDKINAYAERNKIGNKVVAEYNYCACADNSLFAKAFDDTGFTTESAANTALASMDSAEIGKNIRHLQNLDYDTSHVAEQVTSAALTQDIDWSADAANFTTIYGWASSASITDSHFNGIYNDHLATFDGGSKTISNMVIGATYGSAGANAGFFRLINHDMTIKYLHLANPSIEASNVSSSYGHAGAIVAEITSGKVILYTVLAEGSGLDSKVKATRNDKSVGGLVGCKAGDGTLVISNSAASLYIDAVSGAAGGLVGLQAAGKVDIFKSYVGGHTTGYTDTNGYHGGYYYVLDNNSIGNDGGTDRWNIISLGGAAGGLIGQISGGTTGIEKSFNTASVYSGEEAYAGGIVGVSAGSFAAVTNDATIMDDMDAEDTTDDVVAIVGASGKKLDLAYTVAPVYDVKTMGFNESTQEIDEAADPAGVNGAVFGTLSDGVTGANAYYLAEVYKGAKFTADHSQSTICKIGNDESAAQVQLASYFATGSGADIIGAASTGYSSLEQKTTAYDSALITEKREFPFALWTTFEGKRHFYGDWEPIDISPSYVCKIHFVVEQPGEIIGSDDTNKRIKTQSMTLEEVAVQIPYKSVTTTLPFIPYIPSYRYGDDDQGTNTWIVYWGDQTTALNNPSVTNETLSASQSTTSYKEYGTTVYLSSTDVEQAMERATTDSSGNKVLHLTFVAHYTKAENHYKLELLENRPTEPSAPHKQCRLWVIDATETSTLKTWSEAKDENDVLKYRIPTRRLSGYKFRGWCDSLTNQDVANCAFIVNEDGSVSYNSSYTGAYKGNIDQDMTLYAWYEKNVTRQLTINFKHDDNKGNITDLTSIPPYIIYFDAEKGFDREVSLDFDDNLTPKSVVFYKNGEKQTTSSYVTLDSTDKKLKFSITAMTAAQLRPRDSSGDPESDPDALAYDVIFTGSQSSIVAYVVRYELLDTDANGETYSFNNVNYYKYSDTGSYIVMPTPNRDSTTEEGNEPEIDIDEDAFADKYFEYDDDIVIPRDNSKTGDNYQYGFEKKYDVPDKINGKTVQYVVVVKYARKKFSLNYKARGGTNPDGTSILPEKVPFGMPIHLFTDLHTNDKDLDEGVTRIGAPIYAEAYTFDCWCLDQGETELPETERMPNHTVTITARRDGDPAEYTVAFWYENANDDGYTYVGHQTIMAGDEDYGKNADDWVYPADFADQPFNLEGKVDRDHFEYAGAIPQNKREQVQSNGSTVVNVYFKRKLYTLTFKEPHNYTASSSGTFGRIKAENPTTSGTYAFVETDASKQYVTGFFKIEDGGKWQYQNDSGEWQDYDGEFYQLVADNDPPPQYGVVNGKLEKLDPTETTTYKWVREWVYSRTNDNYNQNSQQFALVGNRYVQLSYDRYWGDWYYYGESTGGIDWWETYYRYEDGSYIELYYDGGKLYSSRRWVRTGRWSGYWVYEDEYTGPRYVIVDLGYGQRYTRRPGDVNNSSDVVQNPSGEEPYYVSDTLNPSVQIKLVQKKGETTYTWDVSPRYKIVTDPASNATVYGFAESKMRQLRWVTIPTVNGIPYDESVHGKWKRNSSRESNYYLIRVIHLKWQADVSQYVPQHPDSGSAYKWFETNRVIFKEPLVAMDTMPDVDLEFTTKRWNESKYDGEPDRKGRIEYYLEALPGESGTTWQNKTFNNYKTVRHGFSYLTKTEEFHDILGFEKYGSDPGPRNSAQTEYNIPSTGPNKEINRFYYTRKKYTLEYMYKGEVVTAESVYYQQSLASYEIKQTDAGFSNLFSQFNIPSDYVFKGWFSDYQLTQPFEFDEVTMPVGNMVVYAKWVPRDKTVKFYLQEGETMGVGASAISYQASQGNQYYLAKTISSIEHGSSLEKGPVPEGGIADAYGDFKPEYQVSKKDSKDRDYTFLGWKYQDSSGWHNYDPSMAIESDLDLYANLQPPEDPGSAQITVHYYEYDSGLQAADDHIKRDNDGNPIKVKDDAVLPTADTYYEVGSVQLVLAETISKVNEQGVTEEYIPKKSVKRVKVRSTEDGTTNEVTFLYSKKEPWTYTIEYYLHYPFVTAESWVPGSDSLETASESNTDGLVIKVLSKQYTSFNAFDVLTYTTPTELAGLTGFCFEHFTYMGDERDDPVIFIQRDETNKLVIQCYLMPDEEIFDDLADDEVFYNGSGQQYLSGSQTYVAGMVPTQELLAFDKVEDEEGNESSAHGITAASAQMIYLHYDWQNKLVDDSQTAAVEYPVNAGVYGVRACAILTVTRNGTEEKYLIWQSLDSNSRPTIHFYIDRRNVFLKSANVTAKSPSIARSTNQSDVTQNTSHTGDGIGFVASDANKITYVFSADAFRQLVGTTTHGNIFDWVASDTSIARNYNIFKEYGDLTVTN